MTKKEKEQKRSEAIDALKKMITPGMRIFTQLQHVSSSGMSRRIRVFIPVKSEHERNGMSIRDISYFAAHAIGAQFNSDHGAVVMGGCGMDMGYYLVYLLASVLFRDGFQCAGASCPHNSHFNEGTERDGKRHHTGDAGYSLSHSWL